MMLTDKSIRQLSDEMDSGGISSEDIINDCFNHIERFQYKINAFITVLPKEIILKQAKEKDQNRKKDKKSILYGIPFVLKDVYNTIGIKTTSASNVLSDYIPPFDATVYIKLLNAGAILIGKMNMDAWGHGGSSENTDFGPVKNPWDYSRVAGGSSGGPAAAISAGMTIFGIGEDTGGSIRNPSAWCNITGLKVTYGRVSRYGTIAYASSFDTVGPMAKSVEDCAYILKAIAGKDTFDATSSGLKVPDYPELLKKPVKGISIGIPKEFFGEGLNPQIQETIYSAVREFEKFGLEVKKISMPMFDYGIPVYYLIGPSETSSNLARYDGIRYGFSRDKFTDETKRRILIGTYALSAGYYDAYYKKAQKARTLFISEYQKALSQCDLLIMPVTPTPPPKIGELMSDPLANLLADVYTVTQNPVGVPSLALPCGFTKDRLPIGMQLVGKMFSEDLLLNVGYAYQQVTNWHKEKPDLNKL